jgi:hypothetical protein
MKYKIGWSCVVLVSLLISACSMNPLKSPCDEMADFCGSKTKINKW